ncbi:MAG TPA: two-component regulator propeller domain-containing protein [Candidatus Binatia bacterium]|nr:two-component regulator propeller domain-containing protein [Candidatus Binatia bacterium]
MQHPVTLTAKLSLIVLMWCACTFALDPSLDISQYAHTAWKIRDGFAKGPATSIAQTQDGYLWLGTPFGLVRFDGVRAVPWQPPAGTQLPSDSITSLFVAKDGTLWIGTRKGLASWKYGLTTYPELAGEAITGVLEDREGNLWVGAMATPHPGRLCSIRAGSIQCQGADGTFGIGVFCLHEDVKGNLWVGVVNGFWRWKPGASQFFSMPNDIHDFGEDEVSLLIPTQAGLGRLVEGRIEPYRVPGLPAHFVSDRLLRDRDGGLWIGTYDRGLVHLHRGKAEVFSPEDGLSGPLVLNLLEDREGNIWVASSGGLDRFRENAIPNLSTKQGLLHSSIHSVLATEDGSVWISTANGLNKWKQGQVSAFGSGSATVRSDGKLNGKTADSFFQDSRGKIWVSTAGAFGFLENDRFSPIPNLPSGYVHDIAEVGPGHLWLANQQAGLLHLFQGKVVQQIPWAGLGHSDFDYTLAADPSGKGLWLGFFDGGVAYFADGGIQKSYSEAQGLGQGWVSGLRFGQSGALWVATQGGLSRIKDDHIATLTSKNGLPCDAVHWSIEDDDQSLWLYTPCGLVRIAASELNSWSSDPARILKATVFDASDGVPSSPSARDFAQRVTKASDGKLWFATEDGVSIVDPHRLPFNHLPPPVQIEKINADGKSFGVADGLRIPPHVRDVTIDYTALSLVAPEKIHFRYKLEGQDPDWREVVNSRQVHYSNLAPRQYTFRVRACNNSGVWNETGASLEFSVLPAFYQTIWFRSAGVVVFLASLWGIYHVRVQQLRQQFNIGLEARVNERTRIARELHDTLLQNFHGLLYQFHAASSLMLRKPDEAKQCLDQAISQTNQALIEGRDAIQGLRSESIAKGNLAELLLATSQDLAGSNANGHAPAFDLVEEGDRRPLASAVSSEMCRIALELMRNAYQHAQAQRIEAEVRYGASVFRLRIRDDGRGIDPKVLKEGGKAGHWGLRGVRERADRVGARLDVWSEAGNGTEVQVAVPAEIAYDSLPDSYRAKLLRRVKSRARRS